MSSRAARRAFPALLARPAFVVRLEAFEPDKPNKPDKRSSRPAYPAFHASRSPATSAYCPWSRELHALTTMGKVATIAT